LRCALVWILSGTIRDGPAKESFQITILWLMLVTMHGVILRLSGCWKGSRERGRVDGKEAGEDQDRLRQNDMCQ
jgi:hypothetical protein